MYRIGEPKICQSEALLLMRPSNYMTRPSHRYHTFLAPFWSDLNFGLNFENFIKLSADGMVR